MVRVSIAVGVCGGFLFLCCSPWSIFEGMWVVGGCRLWRLAVKAGLSFLRLVEGLCSYVGFDITMLICVIVAEV